MRLDYIDASPLTSCETNCASTNGYAIFSRVTHSAHSFTFIRVGASICALHPNMSDAVLHDYI